MRNSRHLPLLLAAVVAATALPVWASPPGSSYRLIFADEFNGTTLDSSKWSAPGPSWTIPGASASTASASMVNVDNGVLTLGATRNGSGSTFTSGSIAGYNIFNFTGGYVEARIQMPSTPGSWPAFWGLYNGWPPEADIMEYPLAAGGTFTVNNNQYSTNYHYTNSSGGNSAGAGVVNAGSNLAGTWHTFGMEWITNTSVAFFLDGTQVSSYTGTSVSQMAYMYMLLDYAVGGNSGGPGTPSLAQWPAAFTDQTKVDWVRVWQKNTSNSSDASSSWNINGGGAFTTAANWTNGTPNFGNESATFGRVGTAAAATISMGAWQVFGGITFDGLTSGGNAGTTAYTLGAAGNQIQLASTAANVFVQATAASTASQTINASVEAWSNTTFRNDMTGGQTLTLAGGVTGNGQVIIEGVGTTVFSKAGNYTGGTTINAGAAGPAVLRAAASAALGSGTVIIGLSGNGTTARLEITGGVTLPNNIDLRGRVSGTPAVENVSGNNVLSGTISPNIGGNQYMIQSDAGNLTLSGGAAGATARGVAIQLAAGGSRVVTLQGAGNGVVSGIIRDGSGTLSLTKADTGTWTLSAGNSYGGPTIISAGTLRLTTSSSVTAATPIASYSFSHVSGTTVINDGSGGTALNGTLTGGTGTISTTGGPVAGMGALVLNGSGTTVDINSGVTSLSGSSSWTVSSWIKTTQIGATILNKGDGTNWTTGYSTFYLGNGNNSGSGGVPDAVRYAGGWVAGSTDVTDGAWHLVTYTDSGGTKSIYVDGVLDSLSQNQFTTTDIGTKIRIGFAADNLDGPLPTNGSLSGINIYNTALSAAQVAALYNASFVAGAVAPLPSTTSLSIAAGGTLDVNGVTQTIGTLSGAAGSSITLGAGRLTVNSAVNSQFDGTISGLGGSLVKGGNGTLTLTGANSFTGGLTINAGTLAVSSDGALGGGTGTVTFSGSGTLTPTASITLTRTLSIAPGTVGTIDTGVQNVTLAGTIGGGGNLAKNGTGILTLTTSNNFAGAVSINAGTLAIGSDQNVTLTGTISGAGTLAKSGAGILTVTGTSNTNSGDTSINQGLVLYTNPIASLGSTHLKVNSATIGGLIYGGEAVFQGDSTQSDFYRGQLSTAYANGAWTGISLISSTAAMTAPTMGVGYLDGATYLLLHGGDGTTFQSGYTVTSTDMLLKYTLMGDADLDGQITLSDYLQIDSGFLEGLAAPTWVTGDFNYDGTVDYKDYALLDYAYLNIGGGILANGEISAHAAEFGSAYTDYLGSLNSAAVPEPGSLTLLLLGGGMILRRRRNKNLSEE